MEIFLPGIYTVKDMKANCLSRTVPILKKTKTKTIQTSSLEYLYKVAITLIESAKFLNEVRDNDMARLEIYTRDLDALSFKCKRIPGKMLSFTVIREVNGKLISGPEYGTTNDVKRN